MNTSPSYRVLARDFRNLCHSLALADTFDATERTLALCLTLCDRLGHRISAVELTCAPAITYATAPKHPSEKEAVRALWWGFAQMMRASELHIDEVTVVAHRHPNGSVCAAELRSPRCDTYFSTRTRIYSMEHCLNDLRLSERFVNKQDLLLC